MKNKTYYCFKEKGPMRVILFEAENLKRVLKVKEDLRALFGIGNHSVHISDDTAETTFLASMLFNKNSIHFLNYATFEKLKKLDSLLIVYKKMIQKSGLPSDFFCVGGSSTMGAYGIREINDLDYFSYKKKTSSGDKQVSSHNDEIKNYTKTIDEIVFDPENHFYFKGLKFASLGVIAEMKKKRNESKDKVDLMLIEDYMKSREQTKPGLQPGSSFRTKVLTNYFVQKIIHLMNGGQRAITDALNTLRK